MVGRATPLIPITRKYGQPSVEENSEQSLSLRLLKVGGLVRRIYRAVVGSKMYKLRSPRRRPQRLYVVRATKSSFIA